MHKIALRKKQNKEKRGEHREMVKAAQPPPMIKEIHEIRDKHNDEIAELFLSKLSEYIIDWYNNVYFRLFETPEGLIRVRRSWTW